MKSLTVILVYFFSLTVSAQTFFEATLTNNGEILSIQLADDFIPPFEAGNLWKSIIGRDEHKVIFEKDFFMECLGHRDLSGEIAGKCRLNIPFKRFIKNDTKWVMKLEGPEAARLNRYFIDSAYVSMQRGDAWLSSYNPRRQFFFGLEENLIHR